MQDAGNYLMAMERVRMLEIMELASQPPATPCACMCGAAPCRGVGIRQRGDSNPCGQSPMEFESISLAARTHCLELHFCPLPLK